MAALKFIEVLCKCLIMCQKGSGQQTLHFQYLVISSQVRDGDLVGSCDGESDLNSLLAFNSSHGL